tara:strand:+ start:302 stop:520 length:219 start_codon:yes stop_codon:yes gene_type:complete
MKDLGIFTWEDERFIGCGILVDGIEMPCGTVMPMPLWMPARNVAYNLDPILCHSCHTTETARLIHKIYPMGD